MTIDGLQRVMVGLDLGGSKIAGLVVSVRGEDLARVTRPLDARPLDQQLIAVARDVLARAAVLDGALEAVGVATAGHVDVDAGTLRMAVNLDAADLPLAAALGAALGAPCVVEHDARAAVAFLAGERPHLRHLAYLSIGTGISAGIISDGRVVRGARGLAGEIGHVVVEPDGPLCGCGLRGCLESVAAAPAVVARAAAGLAEGRGGAMNERQLDAAAVFAAAGEGDPRASEVVNTAAAHLARAVAGLALTFGLERVVIGGGVAAAGTALLNPILTQLDNLRSASPFARTALPADLVELLPPASDVVARGAIFVARASLRATAPTVGSRKGGGRSPN